MGNRLTKALRALSLVCAMGSCAVAIYCGILGLQGEFGSTSVVVAWVAIVCGVGGALFCLAALVLLMLSR